jgi:serine/threonine protein phosphatase 1
VLTHAGLNNFSPDKSLEEYGLADMTLYRPDYSKRYYEDKYVVTGHTPTFKIRDDGEAMVYEANGHIAIDCGCIYGLRLAAYCLDTHEVYYVDSEQPLRKRRK